ncbi:MAG: hypothetical protein ABR549_10705 [Mycobacteriales bacterium]
MRDHLVGGTHLHHARHPVPIDVLVVWSVVDEVHLRVMDGDGPADPGGKPGSDALQVVDHVGLLSDRQHRARPRRRGEPIADGGT